ncbi:hypothetical protein A1O3_09508 [Capronia epimyces CBS 606.96]|uniref:U6 snRNA phosphodiesterase n=1 Tax=Capronia epimyces CBS 606.96 TaxID=1182542 RepID=W9XD17_9EURO|nr:uncharacterized protein A1O3_09508 [Capronia epimyces CBS 606.96]EXJ78347.1 hypothetical protein A1O3_09508 [Capronia epimyces CBS 606.96]
MLVDYSESSSDSDQPFKSKNVGTRKRKAEDAAPVQVEPKPPPRLPASFHSLYAANVRTSATDDPTLHAGRTRQVPHVVGNWSTHVYLEWSPSKTEVGILDKVLEKAAEALGSGSGIAGTQIHSFLRSDLGALLPLHVSLSAPLVLKTEQKIAFQESLLSKLTKTHLKPFTVHVIGLDWVSNETRSRFFLVLRLTKPDNDELNMLLSVCNAVARQFGLATLYDSSRSPQKIDNTHAFHISIAWTLQQPDDQAQGQPVDIGVDELRGLTMKFSFLKLKIGNFVADIPFAKHRDWEP